MDVYEFIIILDEVEEVLDDDSHQALMDLANALFDAGCDDATPGVGDESVHLHFHREAQSLRAAIDSAIADVRDAGCQIARVDSADRNTFNGVNKGLATSGSP